MTGRELVFSNAAVIRAIMDAFVPVADDVSELQVSDDEVGRFFRRVAVQGHMRGRSRPGVSHQGIYAFAADGTTLASGNPLRAERTLALLDEALLAWDRLGDAADGSPALSSGARSRARWAVPAPGGAVLRMTARDLPRPGGLPAGQERYASQWNFDHVWLRPEDVLALVPEHLEVDAERHAPEALLARIARFHLRDIVRGEPWVWGPEAVERVRLTTRVVEIKAGQAMLALDGAVVLRERVAFRDAHEPKDWEFDNSLDAAIAGEAIWDTGAARLARVDLVVAGQRAGAHRYNVRTADPGPASIGFAFELAGDEPWERTPPHALRRWSRHGRDQSTVATVVTGEPYYGT